jgi:hypothetical protein
MGTSQAKFTDIGLGALAQAQAANSEGSNAVTAQSPLVATSAIPTAAPGVVIANVGLVPKFSGKFRVTISGNTGGNQNGAAQSITPGIAHAASAPTNGTTTIASDITLPPVFAGTGASATLGAVYIEGASAPFTIGTEVWLAVTLFQSAAGAFAVAANGISINAVEVP